ncbi:MAG: Crp/Fnr family transcriptional regulator [Planctomycetes bacterium]|nr:Crp/Fnr family transcriptional regulator [Planctomycetota bacterium]
MKDFLRKVPLLKGLPDRELDAVAAFAVSRKYRKNSTIFLENDSGDRACIVRSGLVKIQQVSPDGKAKTLDILDEGQCFGEMALICDNVRSASAIALRDTEVLFIPKEDFLKLVRGSAEIAFNIMRILSARLLAADRQIEDLVFKNLPGRIVSRLFELARKYGKEVEDGTEIDLEITHQEFAEMVGTNRESVSKLIGQFKKEGSLRAENRRFVLVDPEKLAAWG